MKKMIIAVMLLVPVQAAAFVYEQNFVQGTSYETGTPGGDAWNAFTADVGAAAGTLTRITLSGSNDPVGFSCGDPAAVNQLGAALSSLGAGVSVSCGGNTWNVGQCGVGQEINVNAPDTFSGAPVYVLRPTLAPNNPNWGGINSATCGAPTQTIRLEILAGTPTAVPTLSVYALVAMASMLGLAGFFRVRGHRK